MPCCGLRVPKTAALADTAIPQKQSEAAARVVRSEPGAEPRTCTPGVVATPAKTIPPATVVAPYAAAPGFSHATVPSRLKACMLGSWAGVSAGFPGSHVPEEEPTSPMPVAP